LRKIPETPEWLSICGKLQGTKRQPAGLKARPILERLRGVEAPLFYKELPAFPTFSAAC
jgi:hypothetical protein